jgi:hypothetical protein
MTPRWQLQVVSGGFRWPIDRVQADVELGPESLDNSGKSAQRQVLLGGQNLADPAGRHAHGLGEVGARDLMLAHIPGDFVDERAGEISSIAPVVVSPGGSNHAS